MLPVDIKARIARLDPGSLTALVGALLSVEAARIGLSPANLVLSDALTTRDEGLDGLLVDVPAEAVEPPTLLPEGLSGIQIKGSKATAVSSLDLQIELRKPGPKRVLSERGTYVLIRSLDLNPAQWQNLRKRQASTGWLLGWIW
jgi:hypothetical protein